MGDIRQLASAVWEMKPPPCDGCPVSQWNRCANQLLACTMFERYVQAIGNKDVYRFRSDGSKSRRRYKATYIATSKIYERIFNSRQADDI